MGYQLVAASSNAFYNSDYPSWDLGLYMPYTMAGWFQLTSTTAPQVLWNMQRADQGDGQWAGVVANFITGGKIYSLTHPTGGGSTSSGEVGSFSSNTWFHACGSFGPGGTICYFNGTASSAGSAALEPYGYFLTLGVRYNDATNAYEYRADGKVAEFAMWAGEMTQANVSALAAGVCPLLVDTPNLRAYWPLNRNVNLGSYGETPTFGPIMLYGAGTPTDHPRIYYPSGQQSGLDGGGGGGGQPSRKRFGGVTFSDGGPQHGSGRVQWRHRQGLWLPERRLLKRVHHELKPSLES